MENKNYKIDLKDLAEEISEWLKENFTAKFITEDNKTTLTFTNGQKFLLTLDEIR